jgi:hypothetical protein
MAGFMIDSMDEMKDDPDAAVSIFLACIVMALVWPLTLMIWLAYVIAKNIKEKEKKDDEENKT